MAVVTAQVATALEEIGEATKGLKPELRRRVLQLALELEDEDDPAPPSSNSSPRHTFDGASRNMHADGKVVRETIAFVESKGKVTVLDVAKKFGIKQQVAKARLDCAMTANKIWAVIDGPDAGAYRSVTGEPAT